jgi:eukaryotic-like serine/threonine-protein kinase
MALSESKLGPYEILAPLGAGGMGEVYRATDTRLKRQVAIKILPAPLAADPDRLARFQREAEVLASLNHPSIAGIYGLEESNGLKALVMELVEGPTLADRIRQGPIPIDEALPIARQIAAALEAAHEQGIIHRDLKPANIKVREDGTVKVLDFGLAKLTDPSGVGRGGSGRTESSDAPTMTSPAMTGMGIIMGTAAYMSPEQARGRMVDKRTDVWAFGAVLYEMLTGARAFEGEDIAETIASVVKDTPNWAAMPADVPPQIVTLIQRCLDKDRNARIGDMAVARFLLSDHAASAIVAIPRAGASSSSGSGATGVTSISASDAHATDGAAAGATTTTVPSGRVRPGRVSREGRGRFVPWMLGGVGLLLALFIANRKDAPVGPPPVTRLQMSIAPAEWLPFSIGSVRPSRTAMTVSPDGRTIVFAGMRGAEQHLFARPLDRPDATPIPGTQGGLGPFFSPDGGSIAFWGDNAIKRVSAAGGVAATVCATTMMDGWGASWAEDDTIYFADRNGIYKVSAAGGTPALVTARDEAKGERLLLPQVLPGGKAMLFTSVLNSDQWDTANVMVQSLETKERRVLIPQAADARYVNSGHLVFMKAGTLMGVPFNPASQQMTGSPVALIDNVMQGINAPNGGDETGAGQFAISASGTLVYAAGGISPNLLRSMVWLDRHGANPPQPVGAAGPFIYPRVSPDGRRIAVEAKRGTSRSTDLWIYDVSRGAPQRITFNGSNAPVWAPDSQRLIHQTDALYTLSADGGGQSERVASASDVGTPSSWSAAGNAIATIQSVTTATSRSTRIWVIPMAGADHKPTLFLDSQFRVAHPEFSPDGRAIAYTSTESGTSEVYVQAYPGPGQKIRISTSGGNEPIWNRNGKELLYRNRGGEFYSVPIRSLSPFQADAPALLFKAKPGEYDSTAPVRGWDISADGQRFFLLQSVDNNDKPVTTMQVVLNWTEELKRLAAKK